MPHEPEFLGQGRDVSQGEPVPHALQPHATGHAMDKGRDPLGLGEPTPRQAPVACQSVIGEGIGVPEHTKITIACAR